MTAAVTRDDAVVELALRLGDSALILSQRLGAWCGHGPALEEDIALANTALDLLGQARMWLTLAGEVDGRGRDEDALAYRRDAPEFRNLLLTEQPNGDYAQTMTRQFFFDAWHRLVLDRLTRSHDERVAAIAAKALKEADYHLRRSADWVIRLGDGTDESRRRMQQAVETLWEYVGELFTMDAVDELLARGIGCDYAALRGDWDAQVDAVLADATLVRPARDWAQVGSKRGVHTEQLSRILAEMQAVHRAHPGARW
ncbi:1,2-phenylacetyl-CoA epoxidase subunit PaaC [uncultured Methylibium sp.]|uniref:1,2-phenylacetyl-CoA epoxidase subunit PaaC n=1 Tax=uncultured Methylibium sp. TaxID=381093 RepID=UPI0025F1F003|nr:1,2-phenylacetyl-CoA epoxidase subunit PaaC [uncultured Methylibium sp.]